MSSHLSVGLNGIGRKARFQNSPAQFLEVYAVFACGHWNQAMTRHAWNRVDFEHQSLAIRAGHEVHPTPARAAEFVKRRNGQVRVLPFFSVTRGALANVLRTIGFVLGSIVVEDSWCDDPLSDLANCSILTALPARIVKRMRTS